MKQPHLLVEHPQLQAASLKQSNELISITNRISKGL